jgi:hypothetical protein
MMSYAETLFLRGGLNLEQEKVQPLPLSGREVKNAILFKVEESLNKSGHLHDDNAYTSFRAAISVKLMLSDYGREVQDNHEVIEAGSTGIEGEPERRVEENVTVEPAPPNQVRVETGQSVPVTTVVDGKATTRHVKYSPRKAKP